MDGLYGLLGTRFLLLAVDVDQMRCKPLLNPIDEALVRGRGGFSTKLHLSCDGRGRPLSLVVTAGQRNEAPELEAVLDGIRVARPAGSPGRPRKRPERLIADRAATPTTLAGCC